MTVGAVAPRAEQAGGSRFDHGVPRIEAFAIMLSCDMLHSDRTVYGDGLDPRHAVVETGPSCLLCPRRDCAHRHDVPA